MNARILLESGEYRLVDTGNVYHVERRGEPDAMGVTAWRPVSKAQVADTRGSWSDDEADTTILIPTDLFRAMCFRVKEKVSLPVSPRDEA